MMVGISLKSIELSQETAEYSQGSLRCNPGLDNLFGNMLYAVTVCFMVALEDGEIKAICSIDLDVEITRAKSEVSDSRTGNRRAMRT